MEKKPKANGRNKSISKTKSNLQQKKCRRSKVETKKTDVQKNESSKQSISSINESISTKPKYDFSDDSSENELNLIDDSSKANLRESDLKWQGKSVQLKEMKVNIKRMRNKPKDGNSTLQTNQHEMKDKSHHFLNSEQYRNEENNAPPPYGYSLFLQDNILDAVQNKDGGKLMSEESEAFFWEWILKRE